MKKKLLRKLMLGLLILLFITDAAQAGDSFSIPVSCTIPAIPGVNAPPFNAETNTQEKMSKSNEALTETAQGENKAESPSLIQEETTKEMRLIKTFYRR